jgi:hypothetical protein
MSMVCQKYRAIRFFFVFFNTLALQLKFWLGFLGVCCLCATFVDYVLAHVINLISTAWFVDLTFRLQTLKPTFKLDA